MQVSHQETGDSSTVAVAVTAASTASSHIHIEEQRRRSLSVISFSEHHQSAAASNAASSTTPSSTFSSSKKTTPKVRFFQPILDIGSFFTSSHRHFSPFFLLIIAITYFLQGFRNYALGDAILFYFHRFHPNSVQVNIFNSKSPNNTPISSKLGEANGSGNRLGLVEHQICLWLNLR